MLLARLVAACVRHAVAVVLLALLLAAGSLWAVHARLGVTTDTGGLFSASLVWKQRGAELQKAFPQNEDTLVAVIDAALPEEADQTARELVAGMQADPAHFVAAWRPDASPFLERNAFLFLDTAKLQALLDSTIDAQPFLGQLAADPSLAGLAGALGLIAQGVEAGQVELAGFLPALRGFQAGLDAAAAGRPTPLSWQRLLAGPVSDLGGRFNFVLAKPKLDFSSIEPGAEASQALRDIAARLEFVRSGAAHVRLTGSVALADEEFSTVADGAVTGLLGSLALVILLLFLAVRSWRAILPMVLTLILGLLLTAGFAALAVGELNLVSVAFAILFVGIAVDFAIQFCVRLRDTQAELPVLAEAIAQTGRRAGLQILVAALATAAGFLAFTPTDFIGVAQLGLIAGIGMLIAFACTLTFLPAALALLRPRGSHAEVGLRLTRPLDALLERRRRPVLAISAALALAGVLALPHLAFDSDPLHTKNPDTEAMRTLSDMMDDPVTSPYTMDLLAPDMATARAIVPRLEKLPHVDSVLWLDSFVPEDQAAKLPLVADAAMLLGPTLAAPEAVPAPGPDRLRKALADAAARLQAVAAKIPAGSPLLAITADLQKLSQAPDAAVLAANTAMTRFLPLQLDRLRQALAITAPATEAEIPPEIRRDWVAADGRPRVQIVPKAGIRGSAALAGFVAEVQAVAPDAAGSAVTIVRSAETIVTAFRTAAISALVAITVILMGVLRRALDMALVLAPLLLSALVTVILAVLLPLPLNFANIIALPLLLGVGVSFNIYFVMNWRAGQTRPLGSATARAVVFSAMTTATAFASLAISHHPGTASMGRLLLLSLACTVLTTMFFLPALLAAVKPAR